MRPTLALICAAMLLAVPASAQRTRSLEVSRQLRDTSQHRIRVQYSGGRFSLEPTASPSLYTMELQYDEDRGDPIHSYDAENRALNVGLSRRKTRLTGLADEEGEMRLELSNRLPMDLSLDLGAAKADVDLTGVRLTNLQLHAGAAEIVLAFDTPNPVAMRSLDIDAGAASLRISGIADANTSDVSLDVGAGSATLDFSGTWTQDIDANLSVAVGRAVLRVPSDVGIRVDVNRALAAFNQSGLEKRGGSYFSRNYDEAKYRLNVTAQVALGALDIERR